MRTLAAILLPLSLVACQSSAEIAQVMAEERVEACRARGFTPGNETFELCTMLQEVHQRLGQVERRIDFLDSEINRASSFGSCLRCR